MNIIQIDSYTLPETLLSRAISMRASGITWPKIEETFEKEGYRTKNGSPFHNANISGQVLADPRGSHLRQRKSKSMKRAERAARKAKKALTQAVPVRIDKATIQPRKLATQYNPLSVFTTEALTEELVKRGCTVGRLRLSVDR